MPDVNQYTVSARELVELIIKSAGIREGRWFLMTNFGFSAANFGPTPAQMMPGAVVMIQNIGIQREMPGTPMPPEIIVDAAKVAHDGPSNHKAASAKSGRGAKVST